MSGKDGKMTSSDASRIQSANVSAFDRATPKSTPPLKREPQAKSGNDPGFASRAQSAGDKNANAGNAGNSNNSGNAGKSGSSGKGAKK